MQEGAGKVEGGVPELRVRLPLPRGAHGEGVRGTACRTALLARNELRGEPAQHRGVLFGQFPICADADRAVQRRGAPRQETDEAVRGGAEKCAEAQRCRFRPNAQGKLHPLPREKLPLHPYARQPKERRALLRHRRRLSIHKRSEVSQSKGRNQRRRKRLPPPRRLHHEGGGNAHRLQGDAGKGVNSVEQKLIISQKLFLDPLNKCS